MGARQMTVSEGLKEWRLGAGFETQAAAAVKLSQVSGRIVREKDVSRWESGKAEPRTQVWLWMRRAYGPLPFDLIDLTGLNGWSDQTAFDLPFRELARVS